MTITAKVIAVDQSSTAGTEHEANSVQTALKCAVAHIEHMAAWIAKQNAGYSFESLGEDMPGIQAAIELKPEATQ